MTMGRLFTRREKERERRDELLSAYLDDQQSARERARLEVQLATDPALRAELETLRHTVALVRDLPPVPIPRNFILSPTVAARSRPTAAARRRRAWAAPLLTAATAVVSLFFFVALAGDLLFPGIDRLASVPEAELLLEAEAPPPQVALAPSPVEKEVEVEKVVSADTPPPILMETPPKAPTEAEDYAVEAPEDREPTVPVTEGGAPVEEPAALAPTPSLAVAEEAAVAPTAPPTPEGVEAAEPPMGGGGPAEEPAAPAPTPSPAVVEEAAVAPTAPATATPSEEVKVTPLWAEEEETEATEGGRGAPEIEAAKPVTISPWRALEVVLGLAALGLALATGWAWHVRRR